MVNLWVKKIIAGTFVFSNVPADRKEAVKTALKAKIGTDGITAEQVAELLAK